MVYSYFEYCIVRKNDGRDGKKNYLFVCKKNAVDIMIMIMPFLRTNFVIIVLPEIINT